jgi:OPA family glycerol-3-phosphate transporter-like MFS transporter
MFVSGTVKAIYASLALVIALQIPQRLGAGHGVAALRQVDGHWFSTKERGLVVSVWNVGHNVGGGLVATFALVGVTLFKDWGAKFYFNAMIAAAIAVVVFFLMRDTPAAYGLPPVEEYKNDYPPDYKDRAEFNLQRNFRGARAQQSLPVGDRIRGAFIYFVRRRGELDSDLPADGERLLVQPVEHWLGPLRVAAVPGTIACGWVSDKSLFKGGAPTILFMSRRSSP